MQALLDKSIQAPYKLLYFCVPRLRFLKTATGQQYLDFGCGDAATLRQNLAVRPDLNCFCIDIKDFSKDLPAEIPFTLYDGMHIPFCSNTFDIITVNHVLEHVRDPKTTLSELKRIVKAGGHIFIEVPNERSLWGKPGSRFAGTVHFKDDPTHIRPYSKRDLIELCRNIGLKIIKSGISRNMLHLILSPALFIMGLLLPKTLCFMYARNSIIGWASFVILKK
ncbi:MAG: class I SAM-dependent methyltransferase [Deltaproteobacteria bacterium]|nr:class I SAM-dependent methyltransferase [Deltaproteobacteria bacterium]